MLTTQRIDLWTEEEYAYAGAFGFRPNLRTYLHEDAENRPCVLVIPGGGYRFCSPSEGENVALRFYDMGYQVFVGSYSTNMISFADLKLQPLRDISRMVRIIRARAEEFRIRDGQIVLCGFSAGSHLCGSLCVHWKDVADDRYAGISNRPDGAILSYPVITAGEYAHRDSFTALLGPDATEQELDYMSLEKQVTRDTPPIFLWHTASDGLVPVENSCLMAMAMKQQGIPFELHIFPKGDHGLSLSDEDWAQGRNQNPYPNEQMACLAKAAEEGKLTVPPEHAVWMRAVLHPEDAPAMPHGKPIPEVAVWPDLADRWIRENCLKG